MTNERARIEALERDVASAQDSARRANEAAASLRGKRGANADQVQGRRWSAEAPSNNDVPVWDATGKKWKPSSNVPAARVYNSGNLTISDQGTGGWQELTFDSERYDTDSIHSTASNTSRLTAITKGKYIISASIRWDVNATGRRVMRFLLNGTTNIAGTELNPANNSERCSLTTHYDLAADDYIEVEVWQSSTANRTITADANSSPEFMMARLGPTGSGGGDAHDAVTLAADAQALLNLSTQELGLVAKAANLIFAGPSSGGAADPDFRALVNADFPAALLEELDGAVFLSWWNLV